MKKWLSDRAKDTGNRDERVANLGEVYIFYSLDDLSAGWLFYKNAYAKNQGSPVGTSDEILLWKSYAGVVALAAHAQMGLATALTIATWHLAKGRENERPSF